MDFGDGKEIGGLLEMDVVKSGRMEKVEDETCAVIIRDQ